MSDLTKEDVARRQIDSALDLYFSEFDLVPIFSISYASFKVLMDIYPYKKDDNFSSIIDSILGKSGWKSISSVANFLKHADRDPEKTLEYKYINSVEGIIGISVLLYKRITGNLSLRMMAFDAWEEACNADIWNIEELEEDIKIIEDSNSYRKYIRSCSLEERRKLGASFYNMFIEKYDYMHREVQKSIKHGESFMQLMNRVRGKHE